MVGTLPPLLGPAWPRSLPSTKPECCREAWPEVTEVMLCKATRGTWRVLGEGTRHCQLPGLCPWPGRQDVTPGTARQCQHPLCEAKPKSPGAATLPSQAAPPGYPEHPASCQPWLASGTGPGGRDGPLTVQPDPRRHPGPAPHSRTGPEGAGPAPAHSGPAPRSRTDPRGSRTGPDVPRTGSPQHARGPSLPAPLGLSSSPLPRLPPPQLRTTRTLSWKAPSAATGPGEGSGECPPAQRRRTPPRPGPDRRVGGVPSRPATPARPAAPTRRPCRRSCHGGSAPARLRGSAPAAAPAAAPRLRLRLGRGGAVAAHGPP